MNRFATLLDRLAFEPRRNAKIRLLIDYFRTTPDPERGWALAAMTDALSFREAKSSLVKALIMERVDPVLVTMSYHNVGDLSETVALLWPELERSALQEPPSLSDVVTALYATSKRELPQVLTRWLDTLDETGRWALLKLITGSLRIGVSTRLAKTAVAQMGERQADEIEHLWHGLKAPYEDLFAWIEGRGPKPVSAGVASFRPPMLSHSLDEEDFAKLDPSEFQAEWKWDGIRVQAVSGKDANGRAIVRLYSRTGEDISDAFPDLTQALDFEGVIDGELLILREGRVQSFNVLQQRLNRKSVSAKTLTEFPAHIRAYDLLSIEGQDILDLPLMDRRIQLEAVIARLDHVRIDLSPLVPFATWDDLVAAKADPSSIGSLADAKAIEGVMLKRKDSRYLPGRPKGYWYKWKRSPFLIDAVIMYAQRGHGKRASFYSDYTFGVWRGDDLVPVGKAYSGMTDDELARIDRLVRKTTIQRFGPVREVAHGKDQGLVLEIAFEGLQRSTRHKSGLAMRFPRINRIRWDKPAHEADRIETLEAWLSKES